MLSDVRHLFPWPTCATEQAQAAAAFSAAPPELVAELLETLVTLGQARGVADRQYAAGYSGTIQTWRLEEIGAGTSRRAWYNIGKTLIGPRSRLSTRSRNAIRMESQEGSD